MILERFRWARVGAGRRVHIVDPHITMGLTLCGLGEATELNGQYVPERDGQVCRACWSRYIALQERVEDALRAIGSRANGTDD